MIFKLFGLMDITAAILFFLNNRFGGFVPDKILWIFAIYLLIKGAIFLISLDIASIIDVACGGIIILSIFFTLPNIIAGLLAFFLIQKGFLSVVA